MVFVSINHTIYGWLSKWRGKLYIWAQRLLFLGPEEQHAVQGLDTTGSVRLRVSEEHLSPAISFPGPHRSTCSAGLWHKWFRAFFVSQRKIWAQCFFPGPHRTTCSAALWCNWFWAFFVSQSLKGKQTSGCEWL